MHDAGAGRDHFEVVESSLTPTQELIALAVSLVFELNVSLSSVSRSCDIDNYRVVDHHFSWSQRVNLLWVTAEFLNCFTHCCEVNDAGNSGEVLHDHAGWRELNFSVRLCTWVPVDKGLSVSIRDVCTVVGAKHVFKQNLQAVGQGLNPESCHAEVVVSFVSDR